MCWSTYFKGSGNIRLSDISHVFFLSSISRIVLRVFLYTVNLIIIIFIIDPTCSLCFLSISQSHIPLPIPFPLLEFSLYIVLYRSAMGGSSILIAVDYETALKCSLYVTLLSPIDIKYVWRGLFFLSSHWSCCCCCCYLQLFLLCFCRSIYQYLQHYTVRTE